MKRGDTMDGDLKWVVGIAVSMVISFGGVMITTFRNVSAKIAKSHERIDKVKDDYVRRDDLDARLAPISQQLTELRGDLRDHNDRIVSALAELKSDK